MKKIAFVLFLIGLGGNAIAQINLKKLKKTLEGESLSTEEVAQGLKEALTNGVSKGSDLVSKVDGYFKNPEIKIPFPPEVKQVETTLRQMGLGNEVDRFVLTLNRGAEDAAKEAKPIFIEAVRQMTIQDAWAILRGEKDAATQYLKKTTSAQLKEKFKPISLPFLEKKSRKLKFSGRCPINSLIGPQDSLACDEDVFACHILFQRFRCFGWKISQIS